MAKSMGLQNGSGQQTLQKVGLVGVILVALAAMRIGCTAAGQDSALKTAPVQTPDTQQQQLDKDIQAIQNNSSMSDQAKEASINMLKSHSSISGAVPRSANKTQ